MKSKALVLSLALCLASHPSARQNVRASEDSAGTGGNFTSLEAAVSDDGRYVVFESQADNLVPGDTNFSRDVFVHDCEASTTTRVSVSSGGGQGNGHSEHASISGDGRYVVFQSSASNLVADDTNGFSDVFLRDLQLGTTTRISVDAGGEEGSAASAEPVISADGRYVAFASGAHNFDPAVTGQWEIYVRDLLAGTMERASVGTAGEGADGGCTAPAVTDDGRFVAFSSVATNLVPDDTNVAEDIFLRDRLAGSTVRVNVTSDGSQTSGPGGAHTSFASLSNDGRFVAFASDAGNVVPGDTNGYRDVFLRDLVGLTTTRLSTDAFGTQGNFPSSHPSMSRDGRYVVFQSWASNLVPGDGNFSHDVFRRDLWTGTVTRVSLDTTGSDPDGHSYTPSISRDGRWVAFESGATDLVAGDANGWQDAFRLGPLAHDPAPDVAMNGVDGPLALPVGVPVTITIAMDAGDFVGQPYDWWVWAETAGGDFWLLATLSWIPSAVPLPLYQGGVVSFPAFNVVTNATLPAGEYSIHFALDAPDGVFQGTVRDTAELTVF